MKRKCNISKLLIIFLIPTIFVGCLDKNNQSNKDINIFNSKEALNVAKKYLDFVVVGDLIGANSLCKDDLLEANKNISTGTSKVISYAQENFIESGNSAYGIFNVIRSSDSEPKCDLDSFSIKVNQIGKEYKISEIKAVNKGQVYVKNNNLRMIGEDGGKSDLVVKLTDMPKDIYPRENKIMLYKEPSPNKAFGIVALSYKGEKIAISTLGEDSVFISVAYIENSKQTVGSSGSSTSNNAEAEQSLEGLLEKPIAKKVVPLDILRNISVNNFIFTQEEEELIIEFTNESSVNRIKLYKTDDGTPIDLGLDDIFDNAKYNIKVIALDKNKVFIKVDKANNNEDDSLLGEYKIDMEKLKITKI
ncbi:hypothetical protein [Clostridium septicum]|uniref:Lipoprotein n=2 Tax=Clostridium septicum TaxID=1504 RepID=A0A9N7PLZ5_CLOSE|nr:hypothetical protein [Clostridium septicum]AYE34397.1 hypothetical protein CP523_08140 [Clostridium septicum]MDU1312541.1 hypothetical protein [Clostridium septicum]UEC20960.1 hypothetical protein LK444_00620 [Clostridium septicum]USS00991.1 hypothetical protein NH397_00475 [Clostridium septicum]WLF69543.1 hypothetical protein Q6375_00490 [Clostridium septicum]